MARTRSKDPPARSALPRRRFRRHGPRPRQLRRAPLCGGSGWDVFGGADLSSVDSRFAIRGERKPPTNIVVVKVDGTSFSTCTSAGLSASLLARLIKKLKQDGAKVIAFDIQFSEPTPGNAGATRTTHSCWRPARRECRLLDHRCESERRAEVSRRQRGIRFARSRVGNGNFDPDPGGVDRRVPYEVVGVKSFRSPRSSVRPGTRSPPFSGRGI